jgi:hypothetical protein
LKKGKETISGDLPAMGKRRCTAEEKILVTKFSTSCPICYLFFYAAQTAYGNDVHSWAGTLRSERGAAKRNED